MHAMTPRDTHPKKQCPKRPYPVRTQRRLQAPHKQMLSTERTSRICIVTSPVGLVSSSVLCLALACWVVGVAGVALLVGTEGSLPTDPWHAVGISHHGGGNLAVQGAPN